MKKLVNTVVVGTALAATMISGCGANETVKPAEETTPKETTAQTTGAAEQDTTAAKGNTVPEQTTTSTMEEPTMEVTVFEETEPEEKPTESTQEPGPSSQCPMDGYVCGNDYCPNATDWA